MTTSDNTVVAGQPATTGTSAGWGDIDVSQAEPITLIVTASDDGDEPMGEAPELSACGMLAAEIRGTEDAHAQAIKDIRTYCRGKQTVPATGVLNIIESHHL
ncbi:MAG: hypothetical protein E6R06_07220 [Mycobacterium sp.]|nr:MAG: hypothetical protein E6R06_07220 [Mycobacterium sp.]